VAAIPALGYYWFAQEWALCTGVFLGAALTDWLDGYLARKMVRRIAGAAAARASCCATRALLVKLSGVLPPRLPPCPCPQNASTPFGAFLDPVADKLMVAAVLVLMCTLPVPAGPLAGDVRALPVLTCGARTRLPPSAALLRARARRPA
jgi:CDP-diacylglycerol--glycerol-3-phosphate 3-phosphatidyltransferase